MNKNIPVACRPNSFNGLNWNEYFALITAFVAAGDENPRGSADRMALMLANRKWAGPLDGSYNSKNAISDEEDSIAGALNKYADLISLQDREFVKQQAAIEKAAQDTAAAQAEFDAKVEALKRPVPATDAKLTVVD